MLIKSIILGTVLLAIFFGPIILCKIGKDDGIKKDFTCRQCAFCTRRTDHISGTVFMCSKTDHFLYHNPKKGRPEDCRNADPLPQKCYFCKMRWECPEKKGKVCIHKNE